MVPRLPRPFLQSCKTPPLRRTFHSKRAKFTTLDAHRQPLEREIDVKVGDEHEAYVLVPKDIGNAIAAASTSKQRDKSSTDTESLIWHHDRREFTCMSAPHLKLSVSHDLPRQSQGATSPATLYLFGELHTIALDGTEDSLFTEQLRDSLRTLGTQLENLEDM
ncbi:hypothetical protein CC80DRAFT_175582 [Byssothecium circinans]|uniref:Uncharacterized protein n=1 Tax=Byssothecium circinans TaxID=147558 RepID=A0A6A5TJZ1_9PLEO|nr:hypothetical protein CC80DRAFT_175582 [Byssothecium circinans]